MKTYTQGRNLYGVQTKNTASDNLTYGDQIANDDYRHLCALKDWPFLERSRTLLTVAQQQFVNLPYDCDLVREVSVVPNGSSNRYTPRECPSRQMWDDLNLSTFYSDYPEWYFVFAGQIGLWPIPASANSTIYITQKTLVIDLGVADTTLTVATATSGSTTVTTSSALTSLMVGQYIRITYTGAANTGDGRWYEIAGITSSTQLTLTRAYGGTSISAGSAAATIGQAPLLPEAYHDLPWQWAVGTYWQKEGDKRAASFFQLHGTAGDSGTPPTGRVKELIGSYSGASTGMVIDEGVEREIVNPNLTISL